MNSSDIYWIKEVEPVRLALGPRPRSGDWLSDEIFGWSNAGIKHVVSLLETSEISELDLRDESLLCKSKGIEFYSLPIPDRGIPESVNTAHVLISKLAKSAANGEPVYVHCRMGIGRSAMITAGILLHLKVPIDAIFPMLSSARRLPVPDTQAQIDWVSSYAKLLANAL